VEQVRPNVRRGRPPAARVVHAGFRRWRWHLNEMYVKLNGEMVYLWRAVDQEGEILESYITMRLGVSQPVLAEPASAHCDATLILAIR
jgi:transposase-like protein